MVFLYKCRNCGKIDRSLRTGSNDQSSHDIAIVYLCNAIHDSATEPQAPKLLSIHSCGPLITSITDLIGCEPD